MDIMRKTSRKRKEPTNGLMQSNSCLSTGTYRRWSYTPGFILGGWYRRSVVDIMRKTSRKRKEPTNGLMQSNSCLSTGTSRRWSYTPGFILGGQDRSCARISPNCQKPEISKLPREPGNPCGNGKSWPRRQVPEPPGLRRRSDCQRVLAESSRQVPADGGVELSFDKEKS